MPEYHLLVLATSCVALGFFAALDIVARRLPERPKGFPFTPLGRMLGYGGPMLSGWVAAIALLTSLPR
ncbi:MAG: hypothetical protein LCH53_06030 [Bacteroidetes bacterium]|nr:hypothetical protein [Bacteroidota bacterium]